MKKPNTYKTQLQAGIIIGAIAMMVIMLMLLFGGCKKEPLDPEKETITETEEKIIDNTVKLNPDECSILEVRQDGVLNRKEFWKGEQLDSTHHYNLDGLRSFNAYHTGYMTNYQVSTQYSHSTGQMLGKQETWRDNHNRVVKSKQYNADGDMIGEYQLSYICK